MQLIIHRSRICILILGQGVAAALIAAEALAAAPSFEVESNCLAVRRGINSLVAFVERRYKKFETDAISVRADGHAEFRCFLDRESLRNDRIELSDSSTNPIYFKGQRRHAYRANNEVFLLDGYTTEKQPLVASLKDAADTEAISQAFLIDPRVLGMCCAPLSVLHHYGIDQVIGNPQRVSSSEELLQLPEGPASLITVEQPSGLVTRAWIVPSMGYGVVRLETDFDKDGHTSRARLVLGLEKVPDTETWFPARWEFEQIIDGITKYLESATIQVKSLNVKLPPDTFTLAGVDVPAGWPISDMRGDGRQFIWDGKQLISAEQPLQQAAAGRNWPLLALSLIMAAVAALLLWRVWLGWRESSG